MHEMALAEGVLQLVEATARREGGGAKTCPALRGKARGPSLVVPFGPGLMH